MKNLLLPLLAVGAVAAVALGGKKKSSGVSKELEEQFFNDAADWTKSCIDQGTIDMSASYVTRSMQITQCAKGFIESYDVSGLSSEQNKQLGQIAAAAITTVVNNADKPDSWYYKALKDAAKAAIPSYGSLSFISGLKKKFS